MYIKHQVLVIFRRPVASNPWMGWLKALFDFKEDTYLIRVDVPAAILVQCREQVPQVLRLKQTAGASVRRAQQACTTGLALDGGKSHWVVRKGLPSPKG